MHAFSVLPTQCCVCARASKYHFPSAEVCGTFLIASKISHCVSVKVAAVKQSTFVHWYAFTEVTFVNTLMKNLNEKL